MNEESRSTPLKSTRRSVDSLTLNHNHKNIQIQFDNQKDHEESWPKDGIRCSMDLVIIFSVLVAFSITVGITILTFSRYRQRMRADLIPSTPVPSNLEIDKNGILYPETMEDKDGKRCSNMTQIPACGVPIHRARTSSCSDMGRIVGGDLAEPHSWPWQVFIYEENIPLCGGSIITAQWIVTAAHCYKGVLSMMRMYAGWNNLKLAKKHGAILKPIVMVKHSNFVLGSFDNDIALIKIDPPLNFTDKILPICLPTYDQQIDETLDCYVTGWGTVNPDFVSSNSEDLRQLCMPISDQTRCHKLMIGITKNMFCAGYKITGKDACKVKLTIRLGDKDKDFAWYLTGITSWGHGCATSLPGIYTRVSNYLCWIQYVMGLDLKLNGGKIILI